MPIPAAWPSARDLDTAYRRALACDPVSAYGGIVAVNRPLDAATADAIAELFAEVVIAPAIEPAAAELLAAKKNLRVLAAGSLPDPAAPGLSLKTLAGGFLAQSRDNGRLSEIGSEGRDQACARPPARSPTCSSPSPSPSM